MECMSHELLHLVKGPPRNWYAVVIVTVIEEHHLKKKKDT